MCALLPCMPHHTCPPAMHAPHACPCHTCLNGHTIPLPCMPLPHMSLCHTCPPPHMPLCHAKPPKPPIPPPMHTLLPSHTHSLWTEPQTPVNPPGHASPLLAMYAPLEQNHRRLWKHNLAATTLRTVKILEISQIVSRCAVEITKIPNLLN